jgi:hypothetical protein
LTGYAGDDAEAGAALQFTPKLDSVILAPEERRDRLRYARSSIVLHSGFEATVGDWYRGPKPLHRGITGRRRSCLASSLDNDGIV